MRSWKWPSCSSSSSDEQLWRFNGVTPSLTISRRSRPARLINAQWTDSEGRSSHMPTGYTDSSIMDYGLARDIIEYRARNSSQINVAITTGRPRVLHRSIIHPTLDYADRSIACRGRLFADSRRSSPPEQMIPSLGSHFTFSPRSFVRSAFLHRTARAAVFPPRREAPRRRFSHGARSVRHGSKRKHLSTLRDAKGEGPGDTVPWVGIVARPGEVAPSIEFLIWRRLLLSAMRTVKRESLHAGRLIAVG